MTTKRAIVTSALEELGQAEFIFDASPESLQSVFRRLQSMAAQWDGQGIRAGYSLAGGIDSESGLPDTAVDAYAFNLAVRCAGMFGKTLTPTQLQQAAWSFNALMSTQAARPEIPLPGRLPIGTGTKYGVLEQQYFGPDGDTVPGLNDGALEY